MRFPAFLLSACVALISTSAHPQGSPSSRYKIFDSKTQTFGSSPKYFWIDDSELVFVSSERHPDPSAKTGERFTYAISRWNVRSGVVTRIREFGSDRPFLCYSEGVLFYGSHRNLEAPGYQAKLGQPERQVDQKAYDRLFCWPREKIPPLPEWTKGLEVRRLEKLDGGFVDYGDRLKWLENTTVRFYRYGAKQDEGIDLGIGRRDAGKRFRYYEFARAHYFASDYPHHPRPKEVPYPVYWLYNDGRVEKLADIPWGPWRSAASFDTTPTRAGLVMASHHSNSRNADDLAHAGLYLFSNGRLEKILRAWVAPLTVAVSPDGCSIAYTYAPVATQKNNVLQAMRLCEGGDK